MSRDLGIILKRPPRFQPAKATKPEELRLFLVTATGEWHIAGPDFLPSAFGPVTARAECGAQVEAIGSANYSSRPCSACLEKCVSAIKCFYDLIGRRAV